MKPPKTGQSDKRSVPKHPRPLGNQQGVAEKADGAAANVKARIDSRNMPEKPDLNRQHTPNSSGRK